VYLKLHLFNKQTYNIHLYTNDRMHIYYIHTTRNETINQLDFVTGINRTEKQFCLRAIAMII